MDVTRSVVDNCPKSQRSVDNAKNAALSGPQRRSPRWVVGKGARLAFGRSGGFRGYSTRRCGPVVGAIAGFEGKRIKTPLAVV